MSAVSELSGRASAAIRLALSGADGRNWEQLLGYADMLGNADLMKLQEAAQRLSDAAGEILGRRHS